jgi:uncharacterized membrane protein HdeD (DUF308 family)
MHQLLSENWWVVAIRGLLGIGFGLVMLVLPGVTFEILVLSFGIYALLDGIFTLGSALRRSNPRKRRWALIFEGLLNLVAGVLTFLIPAVSAQFIVILIAVWAVTTGVSEIGAAIRLRREIVGEWLLGLGGVLSVIFGVLMFVASGFDAIVAIVLVGSYAILFGLVVLLLGLRLWSTRRTFTTDHRPPTTGDQRPTTDDQRPATNDQRPTDTSERPTETGEQPATPDQ